MDEPARSKAATVISDTAAMIAGMDPVLGDGEYVFCTTPDPRLAEACRPHALSTFREVEGASFVLPAEIAGRLGFGCSVPMRLIVLSVHSALDGIGLTAAVSSTLADAGIACNMVAAYHHDYVFVPSARADDALALLHALSADAATRLGTG